MNMSETKTLDVFGPQASVLQGQIASVLGMPIIMSRFLSSDLNAAGKYDNVTKTRSGLLIFARDSYYQYLADVASLLKVRKMSAMVVLKSLQPCVQQ